MWVCVGHSERRSPFKKAARHCGRAHAHRGQRASAGAGRVAGEGSTRWWRQWRSEGRDVGRAEGHAEGWVVAVRPLQGPGQAGGPAEHPPAAGGRGGRPGVPVRGEGGQAERPRVHVGLLLFGRPGHPQLREAGRGLEEAAADPGHSLPAGDGGEGVRGAGPSGRASPCGQAGSVSRERRSGP